MHANTGNPPADGDTLNGDAQMKDLQNAKVKDFKGDLENKEKSVFYKTAVTIVLIAAVILMALIFRSSQAWYWILYFMLGVWVFSDARIRNNNSAGWGIGTFLLGPIVLPVYLAKRNLKEHEIREGGTGWNILKYFAVLWTALMFIVTVISLIKIKGIADTAVSNAEKTGVAIGSGIGIVMIAMAWFFPVVAALIIGLFIKKSTIVEKGPTIKQ